MKQKREQQQKKRWIFGLAALGVFGLCTVLAIVGLGNSVGEIREAEIAQTPTALLASAGVKEDRTVTLPVTYVDQISDQCVDLYDPVQLAEASDRQWEWSTCNYRAKKVETGMVSEQLNEAGKPEATPGKAIPNRGLNFAGWFESMEGISQEVPGTLQLRYQQDGANFSFAAEDFYPLDDVDFSEGDPVNTDGHNRLFTMYFALPFAALLSGDERLAVTGDDDTFVYLNDELVLDMGGVHGAVTGNLAIDKDGKVYSSVNDGDWKETGVTLTQGQVAKLAVFHADRDSEDSVFALETSEVNLLLDQGTQIAALTEGAETDYIAPLGESKVFEPDTVRSLVLMATIEGVLVVAAAVLTVAVARFVVRQRQQ